MQATYKMLETSNTFRVVKCLSKSFPCNPLLIAELACTSVCTLKSIARVHTPKAGKQGWQPALGTALQEDRGSVLTHHITTAPTEYIALGFAPINK